MGPLWAWVALWLVSAYGLVLLLRVVLSRMATEPVPVLVATPPEPKAAQATPVETPAAENPASEVTLERGEAPVGDQLLGDPEADLAADGLPAPLSPEPMDEPAIDADSPVVEERESIEAGEPWIKEREANESSDAWIKERESTETSEPWVKERDEDTHGAAAAWSKDAEEPAEYDPSDAGTDEDETVEYRSIDLGSLTLGLEATEIQDLYGAPGHVSKLGLDGELWRYPLNATDDRGDGISGVLVLEFQRGRLVRKALEEASGEHA